VKLKIAVLMVMLAPASGTWVSPGTGVAQPAAARQPVTRAEYDRWKTELSNWGRWGKDDQLGALNLITPAKRKQAAALVKDGVTVSLGIDANFQKGAAPNALPPYERIMTSVGPTGAGDRLNIVYHGYAATHIDAFAHRFFDGKMYNGRPWDDITKEGGASTNSIYNLRDGIVTRGVLMDIPRLKGVDYLAAGTRIYAEDLEAWEKKAGVKVSPGDALFIRTGRWTREKKEAPGSATAQAGLDVSVIPWLKRRDIAVLAGEHGGDATPPLGDLPPLAVHDFALIALGVHILESTSLDEVAEAAAARKRWAFMLVTAPLRVPGGTGSPVNPIAVF